MSVILYNSVMMSTNFNLLKKNISKAIIANFENLSRTISYLNTILKLGVYYSLAKKQHLSHNLSNNCKSSHLKMYRCIILQNVNSEHVNSIYCCDLYLITTRFMHLGSLTKVGEEQKISHGKFNYATTPCNANILLIIIQQC